MTKLGCVLALALAPLFALTGAACGTAQRAPMTPDSELEFDAGPDPDGLDVDSAALDPVLVK